MKVKLPRVLEITEDELFRYARIQTEDGSVVWRRRHKQGYLPPVESEDYEFYSMDDFVKRIYLLS